MVGIRTLATCTGLLAIGAAAVAAQQAEAPPAKKLTITALPVAQHGPGVAVGQFHITSSPSGIVSDGIGGGCLVFQVPGANACHADEDCGVPDYIKSDDAGGYCVQGQCWIKPSDRAQCWKSIYQTPIEMIGMGQPERTPEADLSTLPAELFTGPAKNKINVRVLACLNGKFGPDGPPCAGGPGEHVRSEGPARTLTR